MNRRGFLKNSVSIAALLAVPAPVPKLASVAAPVMKSFAVGTYDEFDWRHIVAETAEMAERSFAYEAGCKCECGKDFDDGCTCEVFDIGSTHVSAWDELERPSSADWVDAGFGSFCNRCDGERDEGDLHIIGDIRECVCNDCLDAGERKLIFPEECGERVQ